MKYNFENNNIPEKIHPYTNELRKDARFMNNPEATLQNNQDKVARKKIIIRLKSPTAIIWHNLLAFMNS